MPVSSPSPAPPNATTATFALKAAVGNFRLFTSPIPPSFLNIGFYLNP
jgi:hypothetical protein